MVDTKVSYISSLFFSDDNGKIRYVRMFDKENGIYILDLLSNKYVKSFCVKPYQKIHDVDDKITIKELNLATIKKINKLLEDPYQLKEIIDYSNFVTGSNALSVGFYRELLLILEKINEDLGQ